MKNDKDSVMPVCNIPFENGVYDIN
jgi:hypothetical protein